MALPEGPHLDRMREAIAAEARGHRAPAARRRRGGGAGDARGRRLLPRLLGARAAASWGRLIGMLKAAVIAGDASLGGASFARERVRPMTDSPAAAYATAIAALVQGEDAAARARASGWRGLAGVRPRRPTRSSRARRPRRRGVRAGRPRDRRRLRGPRGPPQRRADRRHGVMLERLAGARASPRTPVAAPATRLNAERARTPHRFNPPAVPVGLRAPAGGTMPRMGERELSRPRAAARRGGRRRVHRARRGAGARGGGRARPPRRTRQTVRRPRRRAWPGWRRARADRARLRRHRLRAQGAGRQGAQHPCAGHGRRRAPPLRGSRLPLLPGFYHHVPDTMRRRIPYGRNPHGVWDNMSAANETVSPRSEGRASGTVFALAPDPNEARPPDGMRRILTDALSGNGRPAARARLLRRPRDGLLHQLRRAALRPVGAHMSWWDFVKAEQMSDEYEKIDRAPRPHALGWSRRKEKLASTRTIGHMAEAFVMNFMSRGNDGAPDRVLNARQRGVDRPPAAAPARARRALPRRPHRRGARRPRRPHRLGARPRRRAACAARSRPTGSSARCPSRSATPVVEGRAPLDPRLELTRRCSSTG